VHPVRDWLDALEWDGEPRITEVLIEVLCAKGESVYLAGVLRRFMIAAVARVMKPGCKADNMLVLVGAQGGGKSTFARVLGEPWSVESHSTFGSKDAAQELDGAWIVEVAELSGMRKSEVETVKNFISKTSDHYRPAYGRHVIDQPRSCVFIGTTNEDKFLVDYTGNRRFWPILCSGRVDLKLLQNARDQLWAEARSAFAAGEQWYLTAKEAEIAANVQEGHRVVSEVEQEVANILERKVKERGTLPPTVSVLELFRAICGVDKDTENLSARRQMETAIGQAVKRSGWVSVGRRGEYRSTTYQYVQPDPPANLSNPY
jgi:putative DNA primase/helicase